MATESIKGTSEGMYSDNKILMKIKNYDGAVSCLELLTGGKTERQIAENLRLLNVKDNVSDETWATTMTTMKEDSLM